MKRNALNELERLVRWIRHRKIVAHNFAALPHFLVYLLTAQTAAAQTKLPLLYQRKQLTETTQTGDHTRKPTARGTLLQTALTRAFSEWLVYSKIRMENARIVFFLLVAQHQTKPTNFVDT